MTRSILVFSLVAPLAACVDDAAVESAERKRPRPSPVDASTGDNNGGFACDGPEDCTGGDKCCATIANGFTIRCQAECLPLRQGGEELCHEPALCSDDRWCITAWGTQPALPKTLAICR